MHKINQIFLMAFLFSFSTLSMEMTGSEEKKTIGDNTYIRHISSYYQRSIDLLARVEPLEISVSVKNSPIERSRMVKFFTEQYETKVLTQKEKDLISDLLSDVVLEHGCPVAASITNNAKIAAIGWDNGDVRFYKIKAQKEIGEFNCGTKLHFIMFEPDSDKIITGPAPNSAHKWQLSGRILNFLDLPPNE